MRKFAAAAVGAAALATSLFTAGSASADTGHQVSHSYSALAGTATPTRIGKVHKFTVPSIKGASGWGNWYWAKLPNYAAFVVVNFNSKDTKADGKNAGLCYKLKIPGSAWEDKCIVNTKGVGKTYTQHWWLPKWNQDKLEVQNAVGRLDKANNTFYTSAVGKYLKLHWV